MTRARIPARLRNWTAAAVVLCGLAACGGGGSGGPLPGEPSPTQGEIVLLAGDTGQSGFADGTGRRARFSLPNAMAVDATGNLFVAETFNNAIRQVTPQGVVTTAYRNVGRARELAFAPDGNLYFTANDEVNAAVFRAEPSGAVTVVVPAGAIPSATSIAVGANGRIYVSSPAGIHHFMPGAQPALLAQPPGLVRQLVVDGGGNLYGSLDGLAIVRITPNGEWTVFAGSLTERAVVDGPRAVARFSNVTGLAFDAGGQLWAAENDTTERPAGRMRRVAPDGTVSSPFGARTLFRYGLSADVAFDRQGSLYILSGNGVAKVSASGEVTPLAGSSMPAPEAQAPILAHQLATGPGGVIYTAESTATDVRVLKYAGNGQRLAFGPAAQGVAIPGVDPKDPATLRTLAMTVDSGGILHVAHARVQQRLLAADGFRFNATGGAIHRITPQGELDTVLASNSFAPSGLAVDASGSYRYLDLMDGKLYRHRASDGTRTQIGNSVSATTVDNGRLPRFIGGAGEGGWVLDYVGRKVRVLNDTLTLMDLAGNGRDDPAGVADGRGSATGFATLNYAAPDGKGNLLVTDLGMLRKVSPLGDVKTIAGKLPEFIGFADDLVPGPLPGRLGSPMALAVDADGSVVLHSLGAVVRVRLQ